MRLTSQSSLKLQDSAVSRLRRQPLSEAAIASAKALAAARRPQLMVKHVQLAERRHLARPLVCISIPDAINSQCAAAAVEARPVGARAPPLHHDRRGNRLLKLKEAVAAVAAPVHASIRPDVSATAGAVAQIEPAQHVPPIDVPRFHGHEQHRSPLRLGVCATVSAAAGSRWQIAPLPAARVKVLQLRFAAALAIAAEARP